MKINRSMTKWVCGVLTFTSGLVLPGAVQADSGLSDMRQDIDGKGYYVGGYRRNR